MRKWLQDALAYGFYLLLVLFVSWPLAAQMDEVLAGGWIGDPHEYARHIWWYGYALANGEPLFHHTYLGYPDGLSAWWLWAIPLQSFPAALFALVMPLPVAYNLMVILRLALNGWAMFYFVRRLLNGTHTDAPITPYAAQAALLAGTAYMLYPAMQGQLFGSHAGLLALWGAPLYVDALYRLRTHTRPQDVLRAALFFVLSLLGSTQLLIYVLLPLTAYMGLARLLARQWGWFWRCVAGAGAGFTLSMVFVLPALLEQTLTDAAVSGGGAVIFGADLLAFATPSFFNPLFTHLPYTHTILGINLVEGTAYVGLVAALLAAVGVWRNRAARGWLAMVVIAWAFSLSPLLKVMDEVVTVSVGDNITYLPTPSALLGWLPVLSSIRTPGRFNLAVGFGVAVIVAYGAAWLLNELGGRQLWRRATRYAVLVVLLSAVIFDYQLFWENGRPSVPTTFATVPDGIAALREDDSINVVLNLPYNAYFAKEALYLQTAHQKPLVAGYIARSTPISKARLDVLQTTLDPALLAQSGADAVILFREWSEETTEHVYAGLGEPFYEDERFAVFHLQQTDDEPGFHIVTHIEPGDEITDSAEVYFYAPEPAWVLLEANLSAEDRDLAVTYEETPVQRMTVAGEASLAVPVLLQPGYTTLALVTNPPCPERPPDATLTCETVTVEAFSVGEPQPPTVGQPVPFERGVTLQGAHVNLTGSTLDVWLSWDLAQPTDENMVRFVQVVSAADESVGSDDTPPGEIAAGEQLNERVSLALPDDLPPGEYRVYTGWYTFPELTRLDVQADVEGSVNNWVLLDTLTVP